MRISELGRRSGLPVATIKFYLREGLLPPGTRTARNQANYDEGHLSRLQLIQVLTVVGRFSLASVREILAAIDDREMSLAGLSAAVNDALFASLPPTPDEPGEVGRLRQQVDECISRLGWQVDPQAPARSALVQVLVALRELDDHFDMDYLAPYVRAADRLSAYDIESISGNASTESLASAWVARLVLFEAAFTALRALAQEHQLALRAQGDTGGSH
ncbi:MerR family transcriptional regulator [Micromonospora sp. KC723]|uniref:MerR family transcriptional regulator n=1 Tax=Micromonospora sp. KC723 TaxID=2530381 RepID=UPI0010521A0D|nr:MerR family transcriptional regulator [Micromonospora sp. KC723]TDB72559.1 MerR family transcriptional regulator [Micromonospora sp. KC723]